MTPVTIHLPDDIAAQYQQDEPRRAACWRISPCRSMRDAAAVANVNSWLIEFHALLHLHGVSFYTYEEYQKDMATLDHLRP